MKRHRCVNAAVLLLAITVVTHAAEVGQLTTFTPNTPAKAGEVNANFDAIKNAVNANAEQQQQLLQRVDRAEANVDGLDSRLDTVESGKQATINGNCAIGSAISAINNDGSVVCEPFQKAGAVYVAGSELTVLQDGTNCQLFHGPRAYFLSTSATSCFANAGVHLPDAVRLTGLSCAVVDSIAAPSVFVQLLRNDIESGNTYAIFRTPSSTTTTPERGLTRQTLESSTVLIVNGDIVTNDASNYQLSVIFDGGGAAFIDTTICLSLLRCKISFVPS